MASLVPFTPKPFRAPTMEDVYADPSYQSRLREGQGALERSAAAQGTLRTGGTLKDILKYGQDYAAGEYQNIYDRALRAHQLESQDARDAYQAAWEQYVFANTPRGGGGGGGYDEIPPPPMVPEGPEPSGGDIPEDIPDWKRDQLHRSPKSPYYDPYY